MLSVLTKIKTNMIIQKGFTQKIKAVQVSGQFSARSSEQLKEKFSSLSKVYVT